MALMIEGGRVPSRWAERVKSRPVASIESRASRAHGLSLALINNMPDPALEDTEMQFFELLDVASGNLPVTIQLYSLRGLSRSERGQQHLSNFYRDFDDLWKSRFDGVIITGTEPREPNLRDEPYWRLLTQVFDWAEESTTSTVLSCLAAHASVLHGDGVSRHRLPDKQFGVFESKRICDHALLDGGTVAVRFPHSRWNEVREDELTAAGYDGAYEVRGRRRRLVCEEEEEKPLRTFPGASRVLRTDSAEGVSARCKEISAAGTGNVSDDAARILRCFGCPADERVSREGIGRSERRDHGVFSGIGSQRTGEFMACLGDERISQLAAVHGVAQSGKCSVRSRDGFPRPASGKTVRRVLNSRYKTAAWWSSIGYDNLKTCM